MTKWRLASVALIVLFLAGIAAAQTPPPQPPPPPPAPLSVGDIVLLLQMKVPHERIERFLDVSGVDFVLDARIGAQIIEAGGDKAMLGAIALARRAAAETPAAPAAAARAS